ncbi:MAG: cytotoxic translational repressor of toxin-antitoxin stability system [Microbacteriaceae bacterium]|nr:cytotoxic translational repressor of toxin-antitoxin stability system [Microbacteriaceae bacterium]
MSKHPAPTRELHRKFCLTEGWQLVPNARGRAVTHHETFKLTTPQGEILRTRISHPPGRQTYSPTMWSHILRDQLHVTPAEFWACVTKGTLPDRGAIRIPDSALPLALVSRLIRDLGMSRSEIANLTADEARALIGETNAGD